VPLWNATHMMELLVQMMRLPVMAVVYSMEMLFKTMQGLQRMADQGIDAVVGRSPQASNEDNRGNLTNYAKVNGMVRTPTDAPSSERTLVVDTSASANPKTIQGSTETTHKEERNMTDNNLNDDKLKLIRYKILFVKRDFEVAFSEVEELVSDNMTDSAYTGWKVSEFTQKLDKTEVPKKWGGGGEKKDEPKYPKEKGGKLLATYNDSKGKWYITAFPEDDKKYLRVFFEVLDRYDREKFKYEERQIEVLEEIRDKI
jgi:hypothetical protein